MAIRITCIKKSDGYHQDPHHAITYVHWRNEQTGNQGTSTRLEIYNWIENGGNAFVTDARNNTAYVGTREHSNGTKFLQTYADGVWTDNLLALPECT